MSRPVNLNTIRPRASGGYDWGILTRGARSGAITVHFGDVAAAAEAFIRDSPMIVGCVAWVKSRRLIAVLAERPVALVVNKEFGLRVQGNPEREALRPLTGGVPSRLLPSPTPKEPELAPVRCVGWTAKGRFGALMHHKFLVRLDTAGEPVAVWTGSFNLTAGAENNIENGMVIDDTAIAQAFLSEFSRVWALSEPLLFAAGTPTPGSNATVAERVPKKRAPAKRKARKPTGKRTPAKKATTAKTKTAAKKPAAAAKKPVAKKTTSTRTAAKTATTRKTRKTS